VFDLGDTWPLAVEVKNDAGVLTASSAITLTITLPDGTTTGPTPTNPSTGRYEYDYTFTQAGLHSARWVSTSPAAAYTDVAHVAPATPTALVSLSDVKARLNIASTDTTADEELRAYINAATDFIEGRIGPVVRRTVTDKPVIPGADGRLDLNGPAISLTTITAAYGSGGTYTVGDYYLDTGTGVVHPPYYGSTFTLPVLVTYVAGRVIVPEAIQIAALDYVKWLWETQRGSTPLPLPGGDFGIGTAPTVPYRILQALEPYTLPGIG
jgi:hypothetical protein